MRDILEKIKKGLEKVKCSGCISGWDRKHFLRKANSRDKPCLRHEHTDATNLTNGQGGQRKLQKKYSPSSALPVVNENRDQFAMNNIQHNGGFPAWIASTPDDAMYATEPPRLIKLGNGSASCIALLPTRELSERLQCCILENRALGKAVEQVDADLLYLNDEFDSLGRRSKRLEGELAEAIYSGFGIDSESRVIPELRQELTKLKKEQAQIGEERSAVRRRLEGPRREQRGNLEDLFSELDEVFINSQILQPPTDDESDDGSVRSDIDLEIPEPCHNEDSNDKADMSLQKLVDGEDLHSMAGKSADLEALKDRYVSMRMQLHCVECNLDTREERFEWEAKERQRKMAEGLPVETQTEVDIYELQATQQYTREVIEAEAEYVEAKAAAMAAGCELSDVESGFPDHPDDGYILSSEEEVETSSDPTPIYKWMDGLPKAGSTPIAESLTFADIDRPGEFVSISAEIDEWDVNSIDVCDSVSLVAEGAYRRRIDKWRTICGLT